MDIWEIMRARHSVRSYKGRPIEEEKAQALRKAIEELNAESGLRMILYTEEPEAFAANKPHYGAFKNCRNYIALTGPKGKDEAIGYYGERLVLAAQEMGLNTCWVAGTYKKGKVASVAREGEKLYSVIAIGYGEDQGSEHRSKPAARVAELSDDTPEWFRRGVEAALLAPTAINQQQFFFRITEGNTVSARAKLGFYSGVDLGIVKLHFELGAGKENFKWE